MSSKSQVMEFCHKLQGSGLDVSWKAFGRVNLVDDEMMRAMADSGCVELRFGVESGSDRTLKRIKKGFTAAQAWKSFRVPSTSSRGGYLLYLGLSFRNHG